MDRSKTQGEQIPSPGEVPADVIISPDTRRAGAHSARSVPHTKVAGAGRQRTAGRSIWTAWRFRISGLVGKEVRVELGGICKSSARPGFLGFPLRHTVVAAGEPVGGRVDPDADRAGRRREAGGALRPGARLRPRLDYQPAARTLSGRGCAGGDPDPRRGADPCRAWRPGPPDRARACTPGRAPNGWPAWN